MLVLSSCYGTTGSHLTISVIAIYVDSSRPSAGGKVAVRVGVVEDGWYNNPGVSEFLLDRRHVHLIGKFWVTAHSLRVLVLGLIEDNRSSFSDLSLCNDLTDAAGIVVGCIKETWISCARNTRVPT
jgi:hypothetical protein